MFALLGRKLGMTQLFNDAGKLMPVTAIECGPCTVVRKKDTDNGVYTALELGFTEEKKPQRMTKAMKGHFQKAKTPLFKYTGECCVDVDSDIKVGDTLGADLLKAGDFIMVTGTSKGKGFQGVMKRHNKSGGGASHGSHFHRAPGSIGMCTDPGRIIKNTKLPGHMGSNRVTIKNLEVVEIDVENNCIFVKGAVPGSRNALLKLINKQEKLSERLPKKEAKEEPEGKNELKDSAKKEDEKRAEEETQKA